MAAEYWGDGYWGDGYWGSGYWGVGGTAAPAAAAEGEYREPVPQKPPIPMSFIKLVRDYYGSKSQS